MPLANKLIQAFFSIGANRRYFQRGVTTQRPPHEVQAFVKLKAEVRRAARHAKRLHWQASYDMTYYRAAQLRGATWRSQPLRHVFQHLEAV